jgi:hypothetical protein
MQSMIYSLLLNWNNNIYTKIKLCLNEQVYLTFFKEQNLLFIYKINLENI